MFRRWLVLTGVLLALTGCGESATESKPQAPSGAVELPQQILLSSSMRERPVPGWTTTVKDLALPAGTVVRPVGNIDDRGIFLGITGQGWWLLGLDLTDGRLLFGPVRLGAAGDSTNFDCYVNGPPNVLCVRQSPDPKTPSSAWVVDTSSGQLTFDGPTDLHVARTQDQPSLEQVGDYAIATVFRKGVYGVGLHGERTWFVPGDGDLSTQFTEPDRDIPPSRLAVQGSGGIADVVFSLADGKTVNPSLPQGIQLKRAVVYPGGFGYEYAPADDLFKERVAFFDETGRKLSDPAMEGKLDLGSLDLPMISADSGRAVFSLDGRVLLQLPPSAPAAEARVIGSRYFFAADADHRQWQQFDLRTRAPGKTCEGDSLGVYYIASDGETAVAKGDGTAQAIDLSTCDTLWSISGSAPDEAKEVWKVNTTLVQRTDDKLFSLVAPH